MFINNNVYFLLIVISCIVGEDVYQLRLAEADNSNIERPCGAIYDVNCVRQFISNHALCKKTYGPAPDPLIRSMDALEFSSLNLTVTFLQPLVRGLNGRIDEFYINKETDNLVMTVEFRDLSVDCNNTYLRFQRRAKEPVVTVTPAGALFPSVLITAVIPNIHNLQLEQAECKAYVNEFLVPFFVTPSALETTDPQVLETVALIPPNIPTAIQDFLNYDAAAFFVYYMQYNICDFGLKIP